MIDFNRPALVGKELNYIQDAVAQGMLCGDGKYTKLCSEWMKKRFEVNQVGNGGVFKRYPTGRRSDHAVLYLCFDG